MSSEMSHVCHTDNRSRHDSWKFYLQDRFQCLSLFFFVVFGFEIHVIAIRFLGVDFLICYY